MLFLEILKTLLKFGEELIELLKKDLVLRSQKEI